MIDKAREFLIEMGEFLEYKNRKYGNSVNDPLQIFSKGDADILLRARMDDKLSRIQNADNVRKNDVIDLIGYLVWYAVQHDWIQLDDLKD
jgi:hypothetical protein